MTGFIYNNNSYTVGYGISQIEYANNGSNTIGYSMYGDDVPVAPLLYTPLRSIKLPGTCWVETDIVVDLSNSYLPTFEVLSKPTNVMSEPVFSIFNDYPANILYFVQNISSGSQVAISQGLAASWDATGYGSDNQFSTSGGSSFYNYEDEVFYTVQDGTNCSSGYSLSSLQVTHPLRKQMRNQSSGNLILFRFNVANTNGLSQATFCHLKITLQDGTTHILKPYLNTTTNRVVIKDELTSKYYNFSGDASGITYDTGDQEVNRYIPPLFVSTDTGFNTAECTKNNFTIYADSVYDGRGVGLAFDGNLEPNGVGDYGGTNVWHSNSGQPHYIGFRYTEPLKVKKLICYAGPRNCIPKAWKLQYKVNGNYVDITSGSYTGSAWRPFVINIDGNYASDDWRLYISSSSGRDPSYTSVMEMKIVAYTIEEND